VVPLDLHGVQRTVAFELDGDHWTSRSAQPCGFMRMRGDFAGPERNYRVNATVTLSLPEDRAVDPDALADVLTEVPTVVRTGSSPTVDQLFDGLSLWLAVREPRWCTLSEVVGENPPLLRDAPLSAPDSRVTAGILDDDGVAVLSREDGELTVLAYGDDAAAEDLLAHVQAWESAGRPGTEGLRIDAYPAGVAAPDGDLVLDKGECRLVLSW
jgi:protein-L-isoaspartate(D-aspartate) O-methyltransferase